MASSVIVGQTQIEPIVGKKLILDTLCSNIRKYCSSYSEKNVIDLHTAVALDLGSAIEWGFSPLNLERFIVSTRYNGYLGRDISDSILENERCIWHAYIEKSSELCIKYQLKTPRIVKNLEDLVSWLRDEKKAYKTIPTHKYKEIDDEPHWHFKIN